MINFKEYTLYELNTWESAVTDIIKDINIQNSFECKLLIMEGLNNAHFHGNNGDAQKPIKLRYHWDRPNIQIEIEDCGSGLEKVKLPMEIMEEKLLNETGRGLYIIQSIADEVELCTCKIIMRKEIY